MTNISAATELRNTWESAAPGWAKWEHAFTKAFSDATDKLIDMAGVQPGMRVLDLACGTGSQTVRAARRVGPSGEVVASDISETMLQFVNDNASTEGLGNIDTLACAAEELPSSLEPFDAAISRMGLMLFRSPSGALEAVRDVLKPGARIAALVFTTPANNPFLAQPMAILMRHAGKPAPAPGSPGIFALGGDGVLENLLQDNGFSDVETATVRAPMVLPSAEDAVHLMREAAGAYRAVVADLDEAARSAAWEDVHEALKAFETDKGFEAPLEAVIGAGSRPA